MAALLLLALCNLALINAAPDHSIAAAYGAPAAVETVAAAQPLVPAAVSYGAIAAAAPAAVYESLHVGPAIAQTQVHHGVIGSRTVQVGSRPVLAGHEFVATAKTLHQPAPYTYVAGEAKTYQSILPLPAPAIPAPASPVIPPAPRNLGPAPADTVTQERILAPVRTHSIITPQVRRIEPELQVNRIPVEVPVPNPVPVEREVIVPKHVIKPFTVEVPQPYAVAQPYEVRPVHQILETPVLEHNTYSVAGVAVAGHPVQPSHQY